MQRTLPPPRRSIVSISAVTSRPYRSSAARVGAARVRSAAAEAAIAAAEKILSAETKGKLAGDLIAKGIDDVRKKLN